MTVVLDESGNILPETIEESVSMATGSDERVICCLELMATGRYTKGSTERILARKWRCSHRQLAVYMKDARRLLRLGISQEEKEERASMALGYLDRIKSIAMTPAERNLSAGIAATKLEGLICGFITVRHEVSRKGDSWESDWTAEQLIHYAETGEAPGAGKKDELSFLEK